MSKKICIFIIAFFVHALGWSQALDEGEKKSLEQKILGIWLTKATPRKGIEYSILDYKSCFCLKHRCENNTSYNKKSFIPFSSRFTFNEDNTFSIAHLITLGPKSPCRYTFNGGTWEISDKKTIKITSPLTVFYTATINGKPWTGNEVCEDITRNADLSFDENGNIAQICIREKSTDKKCKEVKFSIYPACIIDNNRLIDVNNRLETFEPFFEKTLQNLLFTKSYWYPPVDISSLLLSTKSSAIGLLNLYCDLSINDNKFILEAFDHNKSKKMLWSTGGEVNLWQDGTGAIRIAFKFTDEPKITDLLEVDGPFSKEELVHRINRIMLSEKVCYFEPYSCSNHQISYIYDLFEEFPKRITEIKRLNLPRFHHINSTFFTYDKNLQAEQKKYSERKTENQKLIQKLNNQHTLVAAVKNKDSSGLSICLIPLIEEHNNILELTKIEPEALNYAVKEVLGKKESNDNPVVAKKKVKKKRKKKKKKKIIQETHVVEAPKIEEVPQISRPTLIAEAAITAATLAQNWTGELVLDKPTHRGLSRISINLFLAENGEGMLQSSLVNNAGEKEIQSLAISWTYKNQDSLSQLHIKASNDAIIMFDQSFRLPEKLRIEPRSKINHLLLSGEYKSSEFSWELRPTIQEVDIAEIKQYHHLSIKEKTQKNPKRLETLMASIAGTAERVRTFRNTDRQIIDDHKTPQPKKEIPDFKVIDDINAPEFFPYIGTWTGIIYIDRKNVSKPLFAVNFEIGEVNKFEIRDLLTKDILYSDTIGSGVLDDNKQLFLGFRPKELTFSPELFSPKELPNNFEIIAGILVGNKNDFSIHALKTSQSDSAGLNINHLVGIWDDQDHHEQKVHLELFADFTGQMTSIGKDAATKITHFSWNLEKDNDEIFIRFLDSALAKFSIANHADLITYSIDFLDSLEHLHLERRVSLREEESVNSIESNNKPVLDRTEHLETASIYVDLNDADKKLIKRNGFDILYSKEKKVPLAVSYKLKRDYLQPKVNRLPREAFMVDPILEPGERADNKDYYRSGWDRGHMAPSSHMLRNLEVQQESFYLSNIVPQNHHLNAGTWAYLEILGQYFAKIYKDIQIITGPIYMPGESVLTIGDNKVAVPHAFYKIFLYKAGKDIHVLPFILPNEPLAEEENISKYLTSIAEIEENTGLEFLFDLNPQALHSLKNSQPMMW